MSAIKRLDGVKDVVIDMGTKTAMITMNEGKKLEETAVREALTGIPNKDLDVASFKELAAKE